MTSSLELLSKLKPPETPLYPQIDVFGLSPEQVKLTSSVFGISGLLIPTPRETFNPPYGLATLVTRIPGLGVIGMIYRPAVDGYHKPQDATSFRYIPETQELLTAVQDGVSNITVMGTKITNPESEKYSHSMALSLDQYPPQSNPADHLAKMAKATERQMMNDDVVGATTAKLARFTRTSTTTLQAKLCQLGKISDLGPNVLDTRITEPRLITARENTPTIGSFSTPTPDNQTIEMTIGDTLLLATDGFNSLGLNRLVGGEIAELAKKLETRNPISHLTSARNLADWATSLNAKGWRSTFSPTPQDDSVMILFRFLPYSLPTLNKK